MRYASIDIGTNTVKLTIAERAPGGEFVPLVDTSRTTRLGEGMHVHRLRETAIRRTLDALAEYRQTCCDHAVDAIAAVGTAGLRNAVNRDEFVERAAALGIVVRVIPGTEEASLSFLAVRRDPLWRDAGRLAVIDIGGGSTEIVLGGVGLHDRASLPIGAVRLTEAALLSDPPTIGQMAEAQRLTQAALKGIELAPGPWTAVGVGGTLVNMAAVKLGLPEHRPEQVHGTVLTLPEVERQVTMYAELTVEQRRSIPGLDPARADIILGGAIILCEALAALGLPGFAVSCRGLRWGVLYDAFK